MAATPTSPDASRAGGQLGQELVANMRAMTWDRIGAQTLHNAEANVAHLARGESLAALRGQQLGSDDSAIIIGAGPSIRRQNPAAAIRASNYKGAIIATDSAMFYCLKNGIVPDLVLTVDPHATRIVRWFGDPSLTAESAATDDYFKRQDMDASFAAAELEVNREILGLLEEHGKKIRIAVSTSASAAVVRRALETGMRIYWWNPMLDDPDLPDSATAKLEALNGLPSVNAGGNVGAACWMMADAVLGKRHVALTGMDFSYYDDTPYRATQYYREAVALVGEENLDSIFMRIFNPYLKSWFFTDPAYMWYRNNFLEMAADAECKTYNCTGGGILFGDNIEFAPLADFLTKMATRG